MNLNDNLKLLANSFEIDSCFVGVINENMSRKE